MARLKLVCHNMALECVNSGSIQWIKCDGWDHGYYYVRHCDPTLLSKITFKTDAPIEDVHELVDAIAAEIYRRYRSYKYAWQYTGVISEGAYAGEYTKHFEGVRNHTPRYVYEWSRRSLVMLDPYSIRCSIRAYLRERNLKQLLLL